ncbi:MAG: hypothetical protein ACKVQU_06180 [Burkholderiales bacterium]
MRHTVTKEGNRKAHRRVPSRSSATRRNRIRDVPFPDAMARPNPEWLPEPIEDWDREEFNLDRFGIFAREDD